MGDQKMTPVAFEPGEKVHDVRSGKNYWIVSAGKTTLRMPGNCPDVTTEGYVVSDRWGSDSFVAGCLLAAGHPPVRAVWWTLPALVVLSIVVGKLLARL